MNKHIKYDELHYFDGDSELIVVKKRKYININVITSNELLFFKFPKTDIINLCEKED